MRELSASCKKRGLRLGVYLSPQDKREGAGLSGRCATEQAQARYNALFRQQLTELLTNYGPLMEIWFDGSCEVNVGDLIQRHAPDAMVFQSPWATIRWVGNEDGIATYPAWNSLPAAAARSGVATNSHGRPDGDAWMPLECDVPLRRSWIWREQGAATIKSLDHLMDLYYRSVGHGTVLLLNHTPDIHGLIPEPDVRRAAEFGAEIRRRFGRSVAETAGQGTVVELSIPAGCRVDHVMTMEDIAAGERIRSYAVEGLIDGAWKILATGTAVGHKKIDAFPSVRAERLRLRVVASADTPLIRRLAAFDTGVQPMRAAAVADVQSVDIGEWGPEIFYGFDACKRAAILELDLSQVCPEARQYEVAFVGTGGKDQPIIEEVTLLHDGRSYPQWVTRRPDGLTFQLGLTEIGTTLRLRVAIRGATGPDTHGTIRLKPILT
jgi:alpha-L-fucosidase